MKIRKKIFSFVMATAISYRNGNMIVSEEDATKDTGIVWTDYLDCGKKNSGIVQVQGVFLRY